MNIFLKILFGHYASRKQTRCRETQPENMEKYFISESERILLTSKTAPKTNANSHTALHSLKKFLEGEDVQISKLTKGLIIRYERWLLDDEQVCENTAALYLRSLRALYNKVVPMRKRKNIFSDVRTSPCKSERIEAASVSEIRKIAEFHTDNVSGQLARDIFMFSFYCMGMPFIDVYHLRRNQIHGNVLTYRRHKTGVQVRVGLPKEAKDIINRYKQDGATFIFPLAQGGDMHEYTRTLRDYNGELKRIETIQKLGIHLSSYVVRHTWATLAYSETCDLNIVAGALGHTSTKVTNTYISMVLNKKLMGTNRKILRKLSKTTYC